MYMFFFLANAQKRAWKHSNNNESIYLANHEGDIFVEQQSNGGKT